MPKNSLCAQSKKVREDFSFLIEEVVNRFNVNLTKLSFDWDLDTAKDFPNKKGLKIKSKNLKSIASKIASVYSNNTKNGELLQEECKLAFVKHFATYESWQIEKFVETALKPMITDTSKEINETILRPCETEERVCVPNLIKAYTSLYLPFYVLKFPIEKLAFGQFLSYFSRFITRNANGDFLFAGSVSTNEKLIEEHLVTLFNNLSLERKESFNISVFELVKLFHLPKRGINEAVPYANHIMKKIGCGWNERKKLNKQWMDWSLEKDEFLSTQPDPLTSAPCKNISETLRDGLITCCDVTQNVQTQLESILKVMKYAAQPPYYIETDEEMSLTFQNASFLEYPVSFPLPSSIDATSDKLYGDAVINYNPKIPICQYSDNPAYPKITNCSLFFRSITNEGLGYTFNGPNFWAMHRETSFSQIFANIMYPKGGQGSRPVNLRDGLLDSYIDAGVRFPETSGPSYGLSIVLDAVHLYSGIRENTTYKRIKTPFKVN